MQTAPLNVSIHRESETFAATADDGRTIATAPGYRSLLVEIGWACKRMGIDAVRIDGGDAIDAASLTA